MLRHVQRNPHPIRKSSNRLSWLPVARPLALVLAVVVLGTFALAPWVAEAAERVTTRAAAHDGYARIVFDWETPVRYSAGIAGRRLTVRFSRPMETAFGSLNRRLADYIASISVAEGGRVVTATLKDKFRLRTFLAGNRVVVDLMRPGAAVRKAAKKGIRRKAKAGSRAKAKAKAGSKHSRKVTKSAPESGLQVRAGRYTAFARLFFDWSSKVGYQVSREGQTLTLQFDTNAAVDQPALRGLLPSQISAAVAQRTPDGLRVALMVSETARVKHYRRGNSVVLDVLPPRRGRLGRRTGSRPYWGDIRRPPAQAGEGASAGLAKPSTGSAVPRRLQGPRPLTTGRRTKPEPAPTGGTTGASRSPATANAGAKPAKDKKAAASGSVDGALPLVTVHAVRKSFGTSIRFNWRENVAAAVYLRESTLWIVFDRPARLDLKTIKVVGRSVFDSVQQVKVPGAAVARLGMTMNHNATVEREGTIWTVNVGRVQTRIAKPIRLRTRREGRDGSSVVLDVQGVKRHIQVRDPVVGDLTHVFPFTGVGQGVPTGRSFPELDVLASAQGLALRPIDDSLKISVSPRRITVSRRGGLKVSRKSDLARQRGAGKPRRLLDFAQWRVGPETEFSNIEHELLQLVVKARGLQRNAVRLSLARFYVSHGMAARALGVVRALVRDDKGMLRDRGVRMVRAMAQYLLGHYADASADFNHPSLKGDPEVYPWRAGLAAARGDWAAAYRLFEDTESSLTGYPPRIGTKFAIMAAEAALSVGDVDTAAGRLALLETAPATESQLDFITFLRGHLLKQQGKTDKAMELWKAVAAVGDRPSRGKASFAIIKTMVEDNSIKTAEAIERYEGLRFAWRNDVFEFDLLYRLGQLYFDNKDYRRALSTLRRAAIHFKTIKGSRKITKEMTRIFRAFYSSGDADKFAPVIALGLYREFQDLTPPGEEGEILISSLVDRLEKVDLLTQAADLLENRVRSQARGTSRAETGARAARLWLLDREPAKALAVLRSSAAPGLPTALRERRLQLRVGALTESGRHKKALAMLGDDHSVASDRLRVEILWRGKRWREAAWVLARLTGGLDSENFDEDAAKLMLRRAVALALSDNTKGLAYVRTRFGEAMSKTREAQAFLAVVGKKRPETDSYVVLAQKASELDTFTGFHKQLKAKRKKASKRKMR